jgi:hypothetical protein
MRGMSAGELVKTPTEQILHILLGIYRFDVFSLFLQQAS